MQFCDRPTFATWSPDFSSSELPNPVWTRAKCDKTELCNSLEYVEWDQNPVQVQICGASGTVGCASGGYVHTSTVDDYVFWTMPQIGKVGEPTIDRLFPATGLVKLGAIAFPIESWTQFRAVAPHVPEARCLPRANGRALWDAWALGQGRPKAVGRLLPMLRARLLGAENRETAYAMQRIEPWLDWFGQRGDLKMDGAIVEPLRVNATLETLYFDGPREEDWPALARFGDSLVPALDPAHIFVS